MSLDVMIQINSETGEKIPVFEFNITHNLSSMAAEAGIYKELWRPEEIDIDCARELIKPLTEGLGKLIAQPDRFKAFNPKNGWGNYDTLKNFVVAYLKACTEFPEGEVWVTR